MLLAIDSATQMMSLALHDGHQLLTEQSWPTDNNHTTELAPAVQRLLATASVPVDSLTALAVCIGPGTYNGLRIGVALAKGIASARGLPLVGISAMDILAAAQPQMSGGLVTLARAGRSRFIAGTYQWRKGHWTARGELRLMDWPMLMETIDGPATLTGEIDDEGQEAIAAAQARGVPVSVAPAAFRLRRAGFLAQEAWQKLNAADPSAFPAANVAPVYVKTKDVP